MRGEINVTERNGDANDDLQLNILVQLSVAKIEEQAKQQFHHASVAPDSTVG